MAFTVEQRKNEYFTFILEEGEKVCAAWKKGGASSKQLVSQAQKYAFSKRLQSDLVERVRALVFLRALELRLEKRYACFFCKLLRLFAFLRERAAWRLLKRVLGYANDSRLRDMISVEMERLAVEVSKLKDVETTSGGKISFLDERSVLAELQSFFDLCVQAQAQEMTAVDFLLTEANVSAYKITETSFPQVGVSREQISVAELGEKQSPSPSKQEKGASQAETLEKGEPKRDDGKKSETPEKTTEKTPAKKAEKPAPSTAIPSEIAAINPKESAEELAPFPVFKDGKTESKPVENRAAMDNTQKDALPTKDSSESVEKDARFENEKGKSPFPVFKGREERVVKGVENPADKVAKGSSSENPTREKVYLSYENQARLALRDSLSDAEKQAIAAQLQEAAKAHAAAEEQKWLEENADRVQANNRISQAPPKDGFVLHNPKK